MDYGFEQVAEEKIILITGLAYFFLLIPCFKNYFTYLNNFLISDALLPLYALFFLLFCSSLGIYFWKVSSFLGYILFIFFLGVFFKEYWQSYHLGYLLVFTFFALWASHIGWAYAASPTLLVNLATIEVHKLDPFYHFSMAEMIKNFGYPSTGFDGVPFMYYHWGSHFLFANLSQFLKISVVESYFLTYPIFFIPLFFYTFLLFILQIRNYTGINYKYPKRDFGFSFWFVFLCIFLQVFKHLYSGGLLGFNFLTSESLTISLSLMLILLNTSLTFWQNKTQNWHKNEYFFLFIFLPLSLALIGWFKVSTMFVVAGWIAFVFFRLKLFAQWQYWLSGFLSTSAFVMCYLFTVETDFLGSKSYGYEGKISWFHFYRHTHSFEYFNFFGLYFLWFYLFCSLYFLKNQLWKWNKLKISWQKNQTFPLEFATVTIIIGIIPSLFLYLSGGNAMYFMCIQIFISAAFLLAFLPSFEFKYLPKIHLTLQKSLKFLFIIGAFLLMYINVREVVYRAIEQSIKSKKQLLANDKTFEKIQKEFQEIYFTKSLSNDKVYQYVEFIMLNPDLKPFLEKNERYHFLQKLVQINQKYSKADKQKTLVYLDYSQEKNLNFQLPCYVLPFIIPSFSGFAQINGMLLHCPFGAYGYEYYTPRIKGIVNAEKIYSPKEILQKAKEKGFSQVLYWNRSKQNFDLITQ